MKTCSTCKEEKDLIFFCKNKRMSDGFHYSCKECRSLTNRKENGTHWKMQLRNDNKKYCPKCENVKSLDSFGTRTSNIDGKDGLCKECKSLSDKEFREKLREKGTYKEIKRQEYIRNIEYYKLNTKNRIRDYKKEYQNIILNENLRIKNRIRNLILVSIKKGGYNKNSRTHEILCCSFEEFKSHIEKQFTKGMSWENHGQWHLDHIYPISLARDEQHLIELNHYTNFQPLWASDNLSKGNKIIEKQLFLL